MLQPDAGVAGVVSMFGSTYNGQYEDVKGFNDKVGEYPPPANAQAESKHLDMQSTSNPSVAKSLGLTQCDNSNGQDVLCWSAFITLPDDVYPRMAYKHSRFECICMHACSPVCYT